MEGIFLTECSKFISQDGLYICDRGISASSTMVTFDPTTIRWDTEYSTWQQLIDCKDDLHHDGRFELKTFARLA